MVDLPAKLPSNLRASKMVREVVKSRVTGFEVSISPHDEPLVQPGEPTPGRFVTPWVLYAKGTVSHEGYEQYHPMREFLTREDAVLMHDLIMRGLAWKLAVSASIDRG